MSLSVFLQCTNVYLYLYFCLQPLTLGQKGLLADHLLSSNKLLRVQCKAMLVQSFLESIHRRSWYHITWKIVPQIDNSEREKIGPQLSVRMPFLQLVYMTSHCRRRCQWQQVVARLVNSMKNLYTSIISPRYLWYTTDGKSGACKRFWYDISCKLVTNLVAHLWIFSSYSTSFLNLGCHTELAYSRWGLTSAVNNLLIISVSLYTKERLISPNIWLVLATGCPIWLVNFNLSSIQTPKFFSSEVDSSDTSNPLSFIMYFYPVLVKVFGRVLE